LRGSYLKEHDVIYLTAWTMQILFNIIQAVGNVLLLVFPLTVLAFRPSSSIVSFLSPLRSRALGQPTNTDVRLHVMARVARPLRRIPGRQAKVMSRKTEGETAGSVDQWYSEDRDQGVTSYQNLILHKDELIDIFIYEWLSENHKFRPVTIFSENYAGQALFKSGFEKGWTYQRTCDYHMHQQVEALGEIVETRPLDRLVDYKLRVMFDAYNKCCKDDRTFADFYKGLVDEISKPEHNMMGGYIGGSICLSMPQDDCCCAMANQTATHTHTDSQRERETATCPPINYPPVCVCVQEIICGFMGWGTWRKRLTDEELRAVQQWQENRPASVRGRQTTSAGRV